SILGNSVIAMSNIGAYDLENVENINGNVLEYRSNIRFGLEYSEVYTLDVASNDEVMGKVSGSGRYEEGSVVDVRATAHPCFRFEKWNDGETANPRQVTMTEDVSLTAIFKSVDSDTLNYDNGVYNVSLGYRQQNVEWGILLLPQHLASRPQLADVMFFVDGEYSYGEYKLSVYQGTDTLPEEKILEDSITVEQYTSGWLNFGFDTLDIDTEMPLWIILSCESEYPAVASTFNGAGYENGSWWNPNGTWTQQTYGAWMIKAVLPLVEEEGGDDDDAVDMISAETIGVYPNPVSSQLYITGIESGETVEIYSIVGTMVATFTYNGDAVDVENLPAGMYVIRSNGNIVKFVKE
ncbi:MAG: T9SS type A sorting domain-containing protein, partial [Bacteroidales bacterium]|nr:T9SS type A sorting domain-containing protein [Bacteroidales bacterium]